MICSRSSSVAILLVAWRLSARGNSSLQMPPPLSRNLMRLCPPFSISSSIRVAPASRLFSISSLTTDAGLSTTSPAAIWFANCGGSSCIGKGIPDFVSGSRDGQFLTNLYGVAAKVICRFDGTDFDIVTLRQQGQ